MSSEYLFNRSFIPYCSGSRVLFSLTSLRSFCLRLPRAALPKTVNGLWSRNATRFLLAAYHSPQAVSGCAGSVGYEQREPDNRRSSRVPSNSFEWPRRQEEDEAKLFEIVSPEFGRCPFLQDFRLERQFALFCGSQNRRPCRPGASRHGGRATGRTSSLGAGRRFGQQYSGTRSVQVTLVFLFVSALWFFL